MTDINLGSVTHYNISTGTNCCADWVGIPPYQQYYYHKLNQTGNFIVGDTWTQQPCHTFDAGVWFLLVATQTTGGDFYYTYFKRGGNPNPPVAKFSGTPLAIQSLGYVQFTDLSTNDPTSWLWDFGDGSTQSVQQNPQHRFTQVGSFTITLTATNSSGSDSKVKTNYVVATLNPPGSAPTAAFSGTPLSGVTPLSVAFTDASTNTPTSWLWNFGDGSTATTQNPTHIYDTVGTFDVYLQATNANGGGSLTKVGYVIVTSSVAFTGTPLTGDDSVNVSFTDDSYGTPDSWLWDFGDGSTTDNDHQNPSHTYTYGTFSVTLTVTYASTGATTYSLTKTAYINVTKSIIPDPEPDPIEMITGGNNPGDGTIVYQLNSSTTAEDPGSKYEHVMTLHSLTNYDLLDSPNYVLFPYTAINLTAKTITYASGTWVTNCYAGMLLMVTADSGTGVRCYGVVASNTGTVITMSTLMYETDIPATGFFIIYKGYNVDFMADISEPTAIENYDVNVDCFEFSDNDDKRKLSTRIVATGKDVFGKTISVMVDAPHAFDATRQFFNNSTVVRKRSEGYIYKNNFVATTDRKAATVNVGATVVITTSYSGGGVGLIRIAHPATSSFPLYSKVFFITVGGTLPSNISASNKYYVIWSDGGHVEISSSISGSAMDLGSDATMGAGVECYMSTLGGLVINNSDGTIVQNSQVVLYGTTAPVGLAIGSTYTNLTTSYTVNGYVMDLGVGIGTGASGDLEVAKLTNGGNFEELGSSPVVWLYGWQYTIPVGSEVAFSIPNSGIDGVPATTTALPQEFSAANNLLLTQVHLSAFPTTDFSGKGYLLNGRLYVGEKTPIGTNEVLIGEEKITVDSNGTDTVYGDWIQFADVTKRVTSTTLKCYPHDVGALVARTNYTAASPEALSPIAEHGLIIDNRTVDGQITYGALDTYASSLLLGFGQFYQIATTWSPMIYGIVPHVGKVSDGTPESNRYRLIQAADRISFTKFSGETAVEYETVAIIIICDEGRILLNLGDFEKNPYTTMIAGTNAINRPLS